MAKRDCKSEPRTTEAPQPTVRHYTIGYARRRHGDRHTGLTRYYSEFPSLHLKGDWLAALGFNTGQPVTVTAERGRLVIESVDIKL